MQRKFFNIFMSVFFSLVSAMPFAADKPKAADHPLNPNMPHNHTGASVALKTADGLAFNNYVTGPENAKAGILLIHEWWGLNDHIRAQADRLGKLGYRALAIDLYDGKVATDPKVAGELMQGVNQQVASAKLKSALDYLNAPGRKLATLGWCFGGGQSLQATLADPGAVSATVIYYGELVTDVDKLKTLHAPVLGIFAKQDDWITPEKVQAFEKAMKAAGKSLEVHSYDAAHAFANPSGPNFNSAAARQAWQVTQEFLSRHLQ